MHFDEIQSSKGWDDETQTKNVPAEIGAGKVLGGGLCPPMAIPLPIWAQPACLQLQPFANLPSYLPACTHIPCLYMLGEVSMCHFLSICVYLFPFSSTFARLCSYFHFTQWSKLRNILPRNILPRNIAPKIFYWELLQRWWSYLAAEQFHL